MHAWNQAASTSSMLVAKAIGNGSASGSSRAVTMARLPRQNKGLVPFALGALQGQQESLGWILCISASTMLKIWQPLAKRVARYEFGIIFCHIHNINTYIYIYYIDHIFTDTRTCIYVYIYYLSRIHAGKWHCFRDICRAVQAVGLK